VSDSPHLEVERALIARGFSAVIGVDEVGRGALAGPVSVGAVAWWPVLDTPPLGVRDSKKVPEKARDGLAEAIRAWTPAVAVGHADPHEVDGQGIVGALGLAAARAVAHVVRLLGSGGKPVVLLDGSQDWLTRALGFPLPVVTQVKADRDCVSVAAASVVAKAERDGVMRQLAVSFPDYGFASHKGYGSAAHMAALRTAGLSAVHRRSFVHSERLFPATD
jgi:ribonuclease HII